MIYELIGALCVAALLGWIADRQHRNIAGWAALGFVDGLVVFALLGLRVPGLAGPVLGLAVFSALLCYLVAGLKGRDRALWANLGFLFGIVALLANAVLPRRRAG
jgi:hypothetical protein